MARCRGFKLPFPPAPLQVGASRVLPRPFPTHHVGLPTLDVDAAVDAPPEIVLGFALPGKHREPWARRERLLTQANPLGISSWGMLMESTHWELALDLPRSFLSPRNESPGSQQSQISLPNQDFPADLMSHLLVRQPGQQFIN